MTFTDDRRVKISQWIRENRKRVGLKDSDFIQMLPMDEERKAYMKYHRSMVFKKMSSTMRYIRNGVPADSYNFASKYILSDYELQ